VVSTPLTGGITNLHYKIDADGKSYVLRITGADTDKLGIRRDVEYCANLAAGRLGRSTPPAATDTPTGCSARIFDFAPTIPRTPTFARRSPAGLNASDTI